MRLKLSPSRAANMPSSETNTLAICKQIQDNYSSCDVSATRPFQGNQPSAHQKNTRYLTP